jgi:hypothetical protein
MNTPVRPRHSSPKSTFVPQLEALEGRCVPACTVSVSTIGSMNDIGVLSVTGDEAGNQIRIDDNGSSDPGNVTVVCDGMTTTPAIAIRNIIVNTLGGDDSVAYQQTVAAPTPVGMGQAARQLLVDLGEGNDTFAGAAQGRQDAANFSGDTIVQGGNGNDVIQFVLNGVGTHDFTRLRLSLFGYAGADVLAVQVAGAELTNRFVDWKFLLDGGAGADRIWVAFEGYLGAACSIEANGGLGHDRVGVNVLVSNPTSLGLPLSGSLFVRARGGRGQDRLRCFVRPASVRAAGLNALIAGGLGLDLCRHSRNVRVVGCEA